jgi:nucleotide-binding universal stress UspA family protein
MTHTLTVGYDGSPQATRAVIWAADTAARDGATLRLVSCFTSPGFIDPWFLAIPVDIDQIKAAAERDVASEVERLQSTHPGVRVEPEVVWGKPRSELVERAAGSELLVVGTTGAGAAESWLLGSVAHAVARSSPCPVVLVPDVPPIAPKGRVVVGIDGSAAADRALEWAVGEADRRDAELVVVHAWQYEYMQEDTAQAGRDLLQVDAARTLDRAVEVARGSARGSVRGELVECAAAEALLNAAVDADLVVVGTRGRGGLRSALFGSVAQAVASRSSRPTVVVREPQHE